jgi:hypothetical protein
MKPNASLHNPDPEYIRGLVVSSGLSQEAAARQIDISLRMLKYYISADDNRPAPYVVQYALEGLAKPQ